MEFLAQKAKHDWIKDGDENTSLFHQSFKARRLQNQVHNIYDEDGVWQEGSEKVSKTFLAYYEKLLGSNVENRKQVNTQLIREGPMITEAHRSILRAPYIVEEVQKALMSIPGDKSPGPDGFGSHFYRDAWSIVQANVVEVVLDTLQVRRMLKELNTTIITLIPKTKCPKNVSNFRPIS